VSLYKSDETDNGQSENGEEYYTPLELKYVEGFELNITLPKNSYKFNEQINVTYSVKNIGEKANHIQGLVLGGNVLFNITNSKGEQIPLKLIINYVAPWIELEIGETLEDVMTIQYAYFPLEKGNYTIAGLYDCFYGNSEEYQWVISLKSNELSLTVE